MNIQKIAVLSLVASVCFTSLPAFAEESGTAQGVNPSVRATLPRPAAVGQRSIEEQKKQAEDIKARGAAIKAGFEAEKKKIQSERQELARPGMGSTTPEQRKEIQAKRQELKAKLKTERNKMVLDHVSIVSERLSNAITQLKAIGLKIQDRIEKDEASGKDVSKQKALFADFQTTLEKAESNVAESNTSVDTILGGVISAQTGAKIRDILMSVQTSVKAAKDALELVIQSIRGGSEMPKKPNEERGARLERNPSMRTATGTTTN